MAFVSPAAVDVSFWDLSTVGFYTAFAIPENWGNLRNRDLNGICERKKEVKPASFRDYSSEGR